MTTPSSKSPLLSNKEFNLERAFKQFSLETEHLEQVYQKLQERFSSVQVQIHESKIRMAGKLAELDFISHYLDALLNHISQGIIFLDSNGLVTTCNAAAAQILQISEKNILFRPYIELFEDHFFGFSLNEVFISKLLPSLGCVSFKRGNESRLLEVEATFVAIKSHFNLVDRPDFASHDQGLLILFRDVTKLRRLQENTHHQDRLKELGLLAAHMAHEIRNPLGGIKGFATLLQQELQDRPDLQQMASDIIHETDRLSQFMTEILQFSRPYQTHFENVEMSGLLVEVIQLVQADSKWHPKIKIDLKMPASPLIIPVDVQLFKSALLNLLVNANQAMPEGGDVLIEVEADEAFAIFRIKDEGIGIPEENFPKIFSPFFTTKTTGTGLGLAEVQKVIQAHQGWIEVQSNGKKGTTFTIRIPLKIEEQEK